MRRGLPRLGRMAGSLVTGPPQLRRFIDNVIAQQPGLVRDEYERQRKVFEELDADDRQSYLFDKLWQQGLDMSDALTAAEERIVDP